MHRAQAENIFRLLNLHYLHPARLWYLVASAGILPCRSTGRARLEGKPAEPRGNDTGLTRWCQVTETFSSSGNSGRMFSTNSFHDLVIPISLNWNGSEELSCPSSHIFVLLSLQPLFCSHSKMSHCFTVITLRSFFLSWQFQTYNSEHLWFSAPSAWLSYHPDHLPLQQPLHSLLMFV